MTIRVDYLAGALFVLAGLAVFALSGDLPFGSLSFPGAGFLPKIIASVMIAMGLALALSGHSPAIRDLGWGDLRHAGLVLVIATAAIALYTRLGFIIVLPLMLFALLVVVERKPILPAATYSLVVSLLAYAVFVSLRAPVPLSPFGY